MHFYTSNFIQVSQQPSSIGTVIYLPPFCRWETEVKPLAKNHIATTWQSWDLKTTLLTKIYQQKSFLLTAHQNTCVVISSGIYGNKGPKTLAQYHHIETEQNTSLEYGQTNLVLHREWQENKQTGKCDRYNQAASLPYPSSISTITH